MDSEYYYDQGWDDFTRDEFNPPAEGYADYVRGWEDAKRAKD
jgi:hypothetical protein